jgi:hypothetical protein
VFLKHLKIQKEDLKPKIEIDGPNEEVKENRNEVEIKN